METEQVLVLLWSRGDLDDGDGEAVRGRGENGWRQRHVVFIQELCRKKSSTQVWGFTNFIYLTGNIILK